MQLNQQLLLLAILIVIVVLIGYSRSFTNDIPTCDGYITNVYIYILLGLLITAFSILFIAKRNYPITNAAKLISFVVAIVMIFVMYAISPQQVLLNHFIWLTFIIALSVSLYGVWRYSTYRGALTNTMLIVLLLVSGLTAVAYIKPDWIQLSWGSTLTIVLMSGILAWVVPLIFGNNVGMSTYCKLLSAGFVVLFSMLILYDTKLLRVKAEQCTYPNYPLDSLGLFLDIVNLYTNVSSLQN